jgi:hypothetical protein
MNTFLNCRTRYPPKSTKTTPHDEITFSGESSAFQGVRYESPELCFCCGESQRLWKYLLPLITLTSQKFRIFLKSLTLSVTTITPARLAVRAIRTSLMIRDLSATEILGILPVFFDLRPRCKELRARPTCHQSSSVGTSNLLAVRYSCLERASSLIAEASLAPATSSCKTTTDR